MKQLQQIILLLGFIVGLSGCDRTSSSLESHVDSVEVTDAAPGKGSHGGRLLADEGFVLELTIFETGVPPEFRVWITQDGEPVLPEEVDLRLTLTRLGNKKDEIGFTAQDDFLRGDMVVYEPHSFVVSIVAQHRGTTHSWQYDNFEGRTSIDPEIAEAFGLETEVAGPTTIADVIKVYGRVVPNAERVSSVSARFDGEIVSVEVSVGDIVRRGQKLAEVESNESFKAISLKSPIAGVVTRRTANPGEQTHGRELFAIMDTSNVWADLAIFPSELHRVTKGLPVKVGLVAGDVTREGTIARLNKTTEANQSVLARVVLDNSDGVLVPGMYLTGEIRVAEFEVPIAVKRTGLQSFRDFTVVYALIGDEYEVRMLDLGRQDAQWVEVLGGLDAGTRYVTSNSYLVKADIEKSGASHDH